MSTFSWKGHACTELEYNTMADTQKPCACGHPFEAHISMLHVMIPCIFSRCGCRGFIPEAETDVGDAARS